MGVISAARNPTQTAARPKSRITAYGWRLWRRRVSLSTHVSGLRKFRYSDRRWPTGVRSTAPPPHSSHLAPAWRGGKPRPPFPPGFLRFARGPELALDRREERGAFEELARLHHETDPVRV